MQAVEKQNRMIRLAHEIIEADESESDPREVAVAQDFLDGQTDEGSDWGPMEALYAKRTGSDVQSNGVRRNSPKFRAAYWTDGTDSVCLTQPQHANLSGADLFAVACVEAERATLSMRNAKIEVR